MTLCLSATIQGEQRYWLLKRPQLGDDQTPTRVGRDAANTIQLLHATVSGEHAEFTFDGGRWMVRDLESLFGTRVNGREARTPLVVSTGDHVELGQVQLHATEWVRPKPTNEPAEATHLVKSILQDPPTMPGWQCHARWERCLEGGGNFYDLQLRAEGELVVLVGKVTGKGIASALLISSTLSAARAMYSDCRSPLEFVRRLHAVLYRSIGPGSFVTMFVGWLEPKSGVLRYVNAAHPEPLLMRRGASRSLPEAGLPVAIFPDFAWSEAEAVVQDGETLAVFSDIISDASDDAESFGAERLTSTLREAEAEHDLSSLADLVIKRLDEFVASPHRPDDVTLVLLRRE